MTNKKLTFVPDVARPMRSQRREPTDQTTEQPWWPQAATPERVR